MPLSKSQEAFIDQKTRQLMVKLADHCLRGNKIPDLASIEVGNPVHKPRLDTAQRLGLHRLYFEHAVAKGWLSKKVVDGYRELLGGGYKVAAAFLKR